MGLNRFLKPHRSSIPPVVRWSSRSVGNGPSSSACRLNLAHTAYRPNWPKECRTEEAGKDVVESKGQTASSVLYIPWLNEAAAGMEPDRPTIPLRKVSAARATVWI